MGIWMILAIIAVALAVLAYVFDFMDTFLYLLAIVVLAATIYFAAPIIGAGYSILVGMGAAMLISDEFTSDVLELVGDVGEEGGEVLGDVVGGAATGLLGSSGGAVLLTGLGLFLAITMLDGDKKRKGPGSNQLKERADG